MSWPLLQDNECVKTENWDKLAVTGSKGLVVMLMCIAWWGTTVNTIEEWCQIIDVLGDLGWVLKAMATRLREKSRPSMTTKPKMKRGAGPHLDVPVPK